MQISQDDWHLVPVDPDPDFDPAHNQRVVDETIRAGELMRTRKQYEFEQQVKERSSAIAKYLKTVGDGKTSSTISQYFGKQELARFRGKEIMDKLIYSDLGSE